MKTLSYLSLLLFLVSCKNSEKPVPVKRGLSGYELEQKLSQINTEHEKDLIQLYTEAEKDPKKVIIKADSLLKLNENEKDIYKSYLKTSIADNLNYLKAELYYKTGQYNNSLKILEKEKERHKYSDNITLATAANYAQLKQFKKIKIVVENICGYHIRKYALGSYYELIKNKEEALKIYNEIKQDEEIKNYLYYKLIIKRFEELNKNNPKLLNEIYFPSGNPEKWKVN